MWVDVVTPSRRNPTGTSGGEFESERGAENRLADVRDDRAQAADAAATDRDLAAEDRDAVAEARDSVADDEGPAPGQETMRRRAAHDRAAAANDRARSVDDRGRAQRNREMSAKARGLADMDRLTAADAMAQLRELIAQAEIHADDMLHIGAAQGALMSVRHVGPVEAVIEVITRAARDQCALAVAAQSISADLVDTGTQLTDDGRLE